MLEADRSPLADHLRVRTTVRTGNPLSKQISRLEVEALLRGRAESLEKLRRKPDLPDLLVREITDRCLLPVAEIDDDRRLLVTPDDPLDLELLVDLTLELQPVVCTTELIRRGVVLDDRTFVAEGDHLLREGDGMSDVSTRDLRSDHHRLVRERHLPGRRKLLTTSFTRATDASTQSERLEDRTQPAIAVLSFDLHLHHVDGDLIRSRSGDEDLLESDTTILLLDVEVRLPPTNIDAVEDPGTECLVRILRRGSCSLLAMKSTNDLSIEDEIGLAEDLVNGDAEMTAASGDLLPVPVVIMLRSSEDTILRGVGCADLIFLEEEDPPSIELGLEDVASIATELPSELTTATDVELRRSSWLELIQGARGEADLRILMEEASPPVALLLRPEEFEVDADLLRTMRVPTEDIISELTSSGQADGEVVIVGDPRRLRRDRIRLLRVDAEDDIVVPTELKVGEQKGVGEVVSQNADLRIPTRGSLNPTKY
jgi:hypothetical protein